jgi:hypothetical protein
MKLFLLLLAIVLLLRVAVFWLRNGRASEWLQRFRKLPAPHKTYLDLRNLALRASRADIGFLPAANPTDVWGVIMDWPVDNGIATAVAFADGSASIYLSSGGGSIGGQAHESIRNAAHEALVAANGVRPQTHLATYFPLPKRGQVFFYLRTDSGVFTARAREKQLRTGRHTLSKLANAMQTVITQYRVLQPRQDGRA